MSNKSIKLKKFFVMISFAISETFDKFCSIQINFFWHVLTKLDFLYECKNFNTMVFYRYISHLVFREKDSIYNYMSRNAYILLELSRVIYLAKTERRLRTVPENFLLCGCYAQRCVTNRHLGRVRYPWVVHLYNAAFSTSFLQM